MTFLGEERWGVIGLGSSPRKIPSRFPSESAFGFHLPHQTPDSSNLRRRLGSAELALAGSVPAGGGLDRPYSLSGCGGGPNRCLVKVPGSTPGKIPNPSSNLGKMTKWVVRYEEDASDPTAVWRIATAANHKADMVQQQRGDFQKVVTGLKESMNRVENLLQRLANLQDGGAINLRPIEEPRNVSVLIQPREMARRVDDLRQINVRSTPEGNFKSPPPGLSVVVTGWGRDPLLNPPLAFPTLNPSHGPELEKQCPQLNATGVAGDDDNVNWEDDNMSLDNESDQEDDFSDTGFDHTITDVVISGLNQDIFSKAGVTIEVGAEIVRRVLSYPLKVIAKNADVNGSVVIEKVHSSTVERVTYSFAAGDRVLLKEQDNNHSQVVLIWDPGTGSKNRKMRHEVKEGKKMLQMSKVWQQGLLKEPEEKQLSLAAISWKESRVCQRFVKRFVKEQELIEATSASFMDDKKRLAEILKGIDIIFPPDGQGSVQLDKLAVQSSSMAQVRLLSLVARLFTAPSCIAIAIRGLNLLSLFEDEIKYGRDVLKTLSFCELVEHPHSNSFLLKTNLLEILIDAIDKILRMGETQNKDEIESALKALCLNGATIQGAHLLLTNQANVVRNEVEKSFGRHDRGLRGTTLFWNLPPWPGFCAMVSNRFAQPSDGEVLENSHSVQQYNYRVLDYTNKFEELIKNGQL